MIIAYISLKEYFKAMVGLIHVYGTQRVSNINLKPNILDYIYLITLTSIMKQEQYLLACVIFELENYLLIIQKKNLKLFLIVLFCKIVLLLYANILNVWFLNCLSICFPSVTCKATWSGEPPLQMPRHGRTSPRLLNVSEVFFQFVEETLYKHVWLKRE